MDLPLDLSLNLFHGMHELGVHLFQCLLPLFCLVLSLEESPSL